jgi:hypothetical protein
LRWKRKIDLADKTAIFCYASKYFKNSKNLVYKTESVFALFLKKDNWLKQYIKLSVSQAPDTALEVNKIVLE